MAEDWQVGDLALCINDAPNPLCSKIPNIRSGGLYYVDEVIIIAGEGVGLNFDGIHCSLLAFNAERFRKIHPHAPDAFDEEVIWHMTCDPVPAGA